MFLKPNELRKRYTEFVYLNRERAMMPVKPMRYTRDAPEEHKNEDAGQNQRHSHKDNKKRSKK